jgi:flagellum-specific peptidoglycan hydrolase FlgJ
MNPSEFVAAATTAALKVSNVSGLLPGITVAQAALESAWGNSWLAREAHNYFGIKAHGTLAWIELPTEEVVRGSRLTVRARFARFGSMEQCFHHRDQLIRSSKYYQAACAVANQAEAFVRALAAHWATDPNYTSKVLAIYSKHGMNLVDKQFLAGGLPPQVPA